MHTAPEMDGPQPDEAAQSPSAEAQEQHSAPEAVSPDVEAKSLLGGPHEQTQPQDPWAEGDKLFEIKKPNKLKMKKRMQAKRPETKSAQASQTEGAPLAPNPEPRTGDSQNTHGSGDRNIALPELPEEASFSLEEEARVAEGRKAKQRQEMQWETEKAMRQKERERERAKEQRAKELDKLRLKSKPLWAIQKEALKEKFPEGWKPRKRLSPDALEGIRALHQQFPDMFTTEVLGKRFEVSPEAIRRILRSKWQASAEEEEDRQRRWYNRGLKVWEQYAAVGKKPPKKWRDAGIAMRAWGGLEPWDMEGEERERPAGPEDLVEEYDEAEMEKRRRMKTQRKLAKNLM